MGRFRTNSVSDWLAMGLCVVGVGLLTAPWWLPSPSPAPGAKPAEAPKSKAALPLYAGILPEKLVPLKDNKPWDGSDRYPYYNAPRHPLDVIASSSKAEPELVAWFHEWEKKQAVSLKDTMTLAEARAVLDIPGLEKLAKLLDQSGLCALAMLEGGQSFALGGDAPVAAVWARLGVIRGSQEVKALEPGDPRGRRFAEALNRTQSWLWAIQKSDGRLREGKTFELLYRIMIDWLPEGDEQRKWAWIGVGDGILLQGRLDESLLWFDELLKSPSENWSLNQQATINYEMGRLYYKGKGQYAHAVSLLRKSAYSDNYKYSQIAHRMLLDSIAYTGDDLELKKEYDAYVSSYAINDGESRILWTRLMGRCHRIIQ